MLVAELLQPAAHTLAGVLALVTDKVPDDEDVKAGPAAFVIFLLLIGAVVVLGRSLVTQLRRAQAAKDAGVYGDDPEAEDAGDGSTAGKTEVTSGTTEPENHSAS